MLLQCLFGHNFGDKLFGMKTRCLIFFFGLQYILYILFPQEKNSYMYNVDACFLRQRNAIFGNHQETEGSNSGNEHLGLGLQ